MGCVRGILVGCPESLGWTNTEPGVSPGFSHPVSPAPATAGQWSEEPREPESRIVLAVSATRPGS